MPVALLIGNLPGCCHFVRRRSGGSVIAERSTKRRVVIVQQVGEGIANRKGQFENVIFVR